MAMRSSSSMCSSRPSALRSGFSCAPAGAIGTPAASHRSDQPREPSYTSGRSSPDSSRYFDSVTSGYAAWTTPQFLDAGRPARRNRLAQAAQHDLGRLLVELHVAAGG